MATTSFSEEKLMRKLRWKLVPYVMLLYLICMLDRVNVGFAALQMNKVLGITASVFGLIAGIFFIGYFLFEVPSNVILHKVGAKRWISRILISWGAVTVLTGFVHSALHLTILRFLLGVAEAGFYPGIILYFTFWFPSKHLAKTVSFLVVGMALGNIIAGPISTWILDHVQWMGIDGWRWLFIIEGIPAVLFGIINIFIMVDRPEQANFITQEEKTWLTAELQREHKAKKDKLQISKWAVFGRARIWHLSFCYVCYCMALYGLGFWMPQILKSLSKLLTNTQIGFISTIPYICAVVVMLLVARHSDKTLERRLHVAASLALPFFGFIGLTMTGNLWLSLFFICIIAAGVYSFVGTFWTLPALFLTEELAAVGIGIINSTGNLGGFIGPYAVGFIKDLTGGSTTGGMLFLAVFSILGALAVLLIPAKEADTRAFVAASAGAAGKGA
jgi:MFS transporter, ACS family, tartrate transporter